mmetsp:Transcript_12527/g.34764  ORF Transcript_12527/g.34764 Transcript_12527/m.34764 type:complete len:117 (-) Transcript_12527:78-428(-)
MPSSTEWALDPRAQQDGTTIRCGAGTTAATENHETMARQRNAAHFEESTRIAARTRTKKIAECCLKNFYLYACTSRDGPEFVNKVHHSLNEEVSRGSVRTAPAIQHRTHVHSDIDG